MVRYQEREAGASGHCMHLDVGACLGVMVLSVQRMACQLQLEHAGAVGGFARVPVPG